MSIDAISVMKTVERSLTPSITMQKLIDRDVYRITLLKNGVYSYHDFNTENPVEFFTSNNFLRILRKMYIEVLTKIDS